MPRANVICSWCGKQVEVNYARAAKDEDSRVSVTPCSKCGRKVKVTHYSDGRDPKVSRAGGFIKTTAKVAGAALAVLVGVAIIDDASRK